MANNEYIESLKHVILRLHGCDSQWERTAPVHEVFRGETVWQGDVEVFDLYGLPKAKHYYAWSHREGPADQDENSTGRRAHSQPFPRLWSNSGRHKSVMVTTRGGA